MLAQGTGLMPPLFDLGRIAFVVFQASRWRVDAFAPLWPMPLDRKRAICGNAFVSWAGGVARQRGQRRNRKLWCPLRGDGGDLT